MDSIATKPTRTRLNCRDFANQRDPIYPPWALATEKFLDACSRCGACITDCPEHILETGAGGIPQVSFVSGACTFCGVCVNVCKDRALVRHIDGVEQAPWTVVASIGEDCLATLNIACQECADHCEQHAIRFRPLIDGTIEPRVVAARCTGCGACVRPCPGNTIGMRPA
ncbi:MAG: ferredoxin-type protein NapF [Gammaproteobacteria bacterium]|nr:MAG: ferredoxin-type protein NapF [Gammaproteobacteria bacterium]TND02616.1 MAG: ferredoxin-type protein NapF [Gammaproteobacteria bacterium]